MTRPYPALLGLALAGLLQAPSVGQQVLIDFENLPFNTLLTTQYPEVTFSSSAGKANYVPLGAVKILCTGVVGGAITCKEDTYLDFTFPVTNLSFLAVEPNGPGVVARFKVFELGIHTATVDLNGLGGGTGNVPVDLTGFTSVTRLEIVDILDSPLEAGIGWDDFSFSPCATGTSYCTAGLSGSGCAASLSAIGSPSATAPSGFSLQALGVEGQKDGLFFWGTNGRQAGSWGNGTSYQCVVPPVKRGALLVGAGNVGACNGSFVYDLNARWTARPNQNPGAGAVVQSQLWYRDPFSSSNQPTSLSDALEFCVLP